MFKDATGIFLREATFLMEEDDIPNGKQSLQTTAYLCHYLDQDHMPPMGFLALHELCFTYYH